MKRDVAQLAGKHFDLLVCGGGIYGAWTAYDAALRGLSVCIVEQGDWASATSSASSKLVHGGLRYLEHYDFKLVRKAILERQRMLALAPHRVWPLRFGVPVYRDSRVGSLRLRAGLMLYDLLSRWTGHATGTHAISHQHLDRTSFSSHFPALDTTHLQDGYLYGDAQTDDARMVLELIDGALDAGAACVNYCRLTALNESGGQVCGATVEDLMGNASAPVFARQVVFTTGPWLHTSPPAREWCRLSKGIHLIMPPILQDEALLLTARSDGRVFFMIPWYGMTLLGTTDDDYAGDPDRITVESAEVAYLLTEANHYLQQPWTEADIVGRYAGVRVMQRSDQAQPADVSRDWTLRTSANGVHHSIGGKLTSARHDAAAIVDVVCAQLGVDAACTTGTRPFPWVPDTEYAAWSAGFSARADELGVDPEIASWLISRHGKRAEQVLHELSAEPGLAGRVVAGLPFILADLLYCARTEMVMHLDDLLRRRMPVLILSRLDEDTLHRIAVTVAEVLGWKEARISAEVARCQLH